MATSKKGKAKASSLTNLEDRLAEDPVLAYNVNCARQDVNAFIEFVMVSPEQQQLQQAPFHEEWQTLFQEHRFVSIWSAVEHGKSTQVVGFILHYLGTHPNARIILVSKNDGQAKKIVGELERYIQATDEVGERLHMVFPDLVPGTEVQDEWSAFRFTIKRPNAYMKDPTVQAFGLGGNPTGSRADLIILDDLLTMQSVSTPAEREKAWSYIQSKLLSRLTKDARVISIGTPFHPEDVLHKIEQEGFEKGIWKTFKFPSIDPITWAADTILWPAVWSLERLQERAQMLTGGEFARQMLCEARDEASALFKAEDIRFALAVGLDYEPVYQVNPADLEPGYAIYTGVDLAVGKGVDYDWSVIFTVLVHPDQTRQVLWVDRGQWGPKEITDKINETFERYQSIIFVESNAAQMYIVEWLRAENSRATVIPFTTGVNKIHPEYGVEGISIELTKKMWIIPCDDAVIPSTSGVTTGDKNIDLWIRDMIYYRRGAHTGDLLMSSWFAREAARRYSGNSRARGSVGMRVIGGPSRSSIPFEGRRG